MTDVLAFYNEHERTVYDLIAAVRDDVCSLYESGHAVRSQSLVYVANPVDAAFALRRNALVRDVDGGTWHLHTAAGLVEIFEDKDHPRGSFSRRWRCACSAVFANNDHRTGECPGCLQRRVTAHLDEADALARQRVVARQSATLADRCRAAVAEVATLYRQHSEPAIRVESDWMRAATPEARAPYYPVNAAEWQGILAKLGIDASPPVSLLGTASPSPLDPLDAEHDGVMLRDLLNWEERARRDEAVGVAMRRDFTPAQRGAVSAHWSAELRAKVAASKVTERNRVTITHEKD